MTFDDILIVHKLCTQAYITSSSGGFTLDS